MEGGYSRRLNASLLLVVGGSDEVRVSGPSLPSSRSGPAVKGGPTGPSEASREAAPLTAGKRRLRSEASGFCRETGDSWPSLCSEAKRRYSPPVRRRIDRRVPHGPRRVLPGSDPSSPRRQGQETLEDHVHGLSKTARSVTNRRIAMSLSNAAPEKPGASWTIPQSAKALTRLSASPTHGDFGDAPARRRDMRWPRERGSRPPERPDPHRRARRARRLSARRRRRSR